MNFTAKQIPPPKYWQEFEDLCLAIFRRVWRDPTATKNGRTGQQQHGTDISGKPADASGVHGIQCKDKDTLLGSEVTEDEFDTEIAKAEKFQPQLEHWTLASTAPKNSKMEQYARERSAAREREGKFAVRILFWEDLQSLMASHPEVIEQFYPDQSPRTLRIIERLEGKPTAEAIAEVHRQASEELAQFVRHHAVENPIEVTIEELTNNGFKPSNQSEVAKALLGGDAIVLEAEPGAGKTTSLLQIASLLQRLSQNSAPLIVPLAEQLNTKALLAKQIFERARLAPIGTDTLNGLALEGHFTFLCDGWNERSFEERAWLQGEFKRIRRDYPTCGLLVTTRQLSPLAIPHAKTFVLRPLTPEQQRSLLRGHDPKTAEALLMAAHRKPGLRSLVQNPFYLRALAVIAPGGELPGTKEETLGRFVRAHDERPEHRDELYKVFQNQHLVYLRRLAAIMAQQGTNSMKETDAAALVSEVSDELIAAGTISEKSRPTPSGALDALVAHHLLLVQSMTGPERLFGFQHHQILEWFASFWIEAIIFAAPENGNASARMIDFANRSASDEVLFFAAERLGKGDREQQRALANLVLRAFDLDVMLAAEIIRRSPDAIWALVADEIDTRLGELSESYKSQAIRFMSRTGRPEFADQLWDELKDEKRYDSFAGAHGRLSPRSLGPDGLTRVSSLSPDFIRSIAWDFCLYAGEEGLEFARALALATELPEVALVVLEFLEFEGAEEEADEFVEQLPPKLWDAIALKLPLRRAKANIRERVAKAKLANAENLTGSARFQALRELAGEDIEIDASEFVGLALGVPFSEYHIARDAIEFAAKRFPKEFQAAAIAALKAGRELPGYASDYLTPEPDDQDVLFGALQRQTRNSRRDSQLARALTRDSVGRMLDELESLSGQIKKTDRKDASALYQMRGNLIDAICSVSPPEVIDAVLARNVSSAAQVNDLSEVIFRLKTDRRDEDDLPVDPEIKTALIEKMKGWAKFFADPGSTQRSYASHYATALGKVPHPELLSAFRIALDYELRECEIDRAEREEWQRTKKRTESARDRTGYYMIYRNALHKFAGEETKNLLLSLLGNATFGESAAFELIRFGSSKPPETGFYTGPRFEKIAAARSAQRPELNGVAAAVLARIDELLQTGKAEDAASAVKIATAAVQMDFGNNSEPIFRAAEKAPTPEVRYNLLTAMLVFGLKVPPDWIAAGYESAEKAFFGAKWQNPQEWWAVRRWLDLLGASDNPELVLGCVDRLPGDYKNVRQLREVGTAIGYSPSSKGTSTLVELSKIVPAFIADYDWQHAVLRRGDEEGAAYILEVLLAGGNAFDRAHNFDVANTIASLFLQHSKIKAVFFDRLKAEDFHPTPLMAEVLRRTVSSAEAMALINSPAAHRPILADALVSAASEFAVKHVPIESNSYEIHPDDLTELRKNLFILAHSKGPQAKLAYRVLLAIEAQREQYGRPPAEPRHPDVTSGKAWPMKEPEG